jgi:hypothetical protein
VDILRKPKERIAHWLLKNKQRKVRRDKAVSNFDTADRVGVIFSLEEETSFDLTNQFLNYLAGKKIKVYALGYIPQKEIPPRIAPNSKINLFTRKDLNWYYMPVHPIVQQFIEQDFDILIDLSKQSLLPLKFVNNLSRARLKVGMESNNGRDYDLMIRIGPEQGLHYLIEQIKHYVSQINKPQ